MMRILLTGGSGQVGGALRHVLGQNHQLITPSRAEFDLVRPELLESGLERFAADLIINPAAYTAVDRAEDEPELANLINGIAPGVIARWASRNGVPFIHFSTDYVFDGSGERPWREDDPCAPLSVYGRSKRKGEQAILGTDGSNLIVRTSWVYSARGTNFMRTMVELARQRTELRVVCDQFGAPTSATSIADAVAALLTRGGRAAGLCEVFAGAKSILHLANSGKTSWHGFARSIVEGLKARGMKLRADVVTPIPSGEFTTTASRPANSRLDISRLAALGIPMPDWEAALARELDVVASEGS